MNEVEFKNFELNEVAEVIRGVSYDGSDAIVEFKKNHILILRAGNINGQINYTKLIYVPNKYVKEKQYLLKGNIVMASSSGSSHIVGKCALVLEDRIQSFGAFCYGIKPKNVNSFFLNFYFKSNTYKHSLKKLIKGANIKNLRFTELQSLKIPIPVNTAGKPDLHYQQKIVDELEKIEKAIEKKKMAIELNKEYLESLFYVSFGSPVKNEKGWAVENLGKLSKVGSSTRVFTKDLVSEGIPFYRGTEISALSKGKFKKSKLFISHEHYADLKLTYDMPKIGDLLLPSICSGGEIWMVNSNKPFYFKDGRVLWINIYSEKINNTYLKSFLIELFRCSYSKFASGTTFAELKIFALKNIEVMCPPITLQNKFADEVEKFEKLRTIQENSLNELEDLFNSTIQKAFQGKL